MRCGGSMMSFLATNALVDIIAQIIAARNYVSYYQNHIWIIASYYETLCIIASYYETLCIIALIIASYYETLCIIALIIASYYETLCIIAQRDQNEITGDAYILAKSTHSHVTDGTCAQLTRALALLAAAAESMLVAAARGWWRGVVMR
jgi:hypothetical protein